MAVAEDYVRNLRSEIIKGQRGQLERGYYPFSAPIGYRNNGKRKLKTIHPVLGPYLKQAFELYATGQYSLETLRVEMARQGFTQDNGKPRSRGFFEAVLANPFYAGIIRIKRTGETFPGAHEPLISVNTFQRVAEVRSGRAHKRFTRHQHLFRGLFACGNCGRGMIPERQKGHCYYRCHFSECRGNSVREEQLEDAVLRTLQSSRLTDEAADKIEAEVAEWVKQAKRADSASTIDMKLGEIAERLDKLEDAAIEQIIDKENFAKRKEKLLLERAKLTEQRDETAKFHQNPVIVRRFLERVKNLAEHYQNAPDPEKREIVEIVVSNRTVTRKHVSVEPANWLQATRKAVGVLGCADAGTTSRTSGGETGDLIKALVEVAAQFPQYDKQNNSAVKSNQP